MMFETLENEKLNKELFNEKNTIVEEITNKEIIKDNENINLLIDIHLNKLLFQPL